MTTLNLKAHCVNQLHPSICVCNHTSCRRLPCSIQSATISVREYSPRGATIPSLNENSGGMWKSLQSGYKSYRRLRVSSQRIRQPRWTPSILHVLNRCATQKNENLGPAHNASQVFVRPEKLRKCALLSHYAMLYCLPSGAMGPNSGDGCFLALALKSLVFCSLTAQDFNHWQQYLSTWQDLPCRPLLPASHCWLLPRVINFDSFC